MQSEVKYYISWNEFFWHCWQGSVVIFDLMTMTDSSVAIVGLHLIGWQAPDVCHKVWQKLFQRNVFPNVMSWWKLDSLASIIIIIWCDVQSRAFFSYTEKLMLKPDCLYNCDGSKKSVHFRKGKRILWFIDRGHAQGVANVGESFL